MLKNEIVFKGEFVPAQEKSYVHLPFDVPPHTTRIEVEYSYSQQIDSDPLLRGGNTIDLGLFDERGIDFLNAGFRGWSGSERLNIFIGETEATPGYLAGAIHAGQWHVLLGLYKIAREGCTYRVTVTLTTQNENAARTHDAIRKNDLPSSPIAQRHGKWLRGEMHCHTLHSDGDSTVENLVNMARARGLDFLAITDHNSVSHQCVLETLSDPGLILIRGVEVTTFKGHWNAWGIPDWIDFRATRPEQMRAAIQFANARGALTSCNHPKPFGPMWEYAEVEDYHCIEVWNGPWQARNEDSLAFWTERLAQGKRFVAVGGSDWHHFQELDAAPPRAPGTPTMWVYVDETPSADTILDAIRRGHVALADEPNGALLELAVCPLIQETDGALYDLCVEPERAARGGDALERAPESLVQVRCRRGAGNILQVFDDAREWLRQEISQDDQTITFAVQTAHSLYLRAELRDGQGEMQALTNPIYFYEAVS